MRDDPDQQFHHYREWEDWKAGMYARSLRTGVIAECAHLLSDATEFGQALDDAIRAWPIAASQNLSNPYRNHRPWCGRAACCFRLGATVVEVNAAWAQIPADRQTAANAVADQAHAAWLAENRPEGYLF